MLRTEPAARRRRIQSATKRGQSIFVLHVVARYMLYAASSPVACCMPAGAEQSRAEQSARKRGWTQRVHGHEYICATGTLSTRRTMLVWQEAHVPGDRQEHALEGVFAACAAAVVPVCGLVEDHNTAHPQSLLQASTLEHPVQYCHTESPGRATFRPSRLESRNASPACEPMPREGRTGLTPATSAQDWAHPCPHSAPVVVPCAGEAGCACSESA
jgi:hypothetical protein